MRSAPVLTLDAVVIVPGGKALSLELFPRDAYAVMGPALSAKSQLMNIVRGDARPVSGAMSLHGTMAMPRDKEYNRRHTPQGIAKSVGKRCSSSRLTQVLSGLGLWDVRQVPIVQLPEEVIAACDLLPVFLGEEQISIIDRQLDRMDSWTRETTLELIKDEQSKGRAFVISTNLVTVAQQMGWVIVVSGQSPVFAGPVADLLRSMTPTEILVETTDPSAVITMVESFSISVREIPEGVRIVADKGQELAARLLTEGYGRVRAVVVKEPTLTDVLKEIAH